MQMDPRSNYHSFCQNYAQLQCALYSYSKCLCSVMRWCVQEYTTLCNSLSDSTEMAQIELQTTQHREEASSSVATQNTFSLCGSDAKWLLTLKAILMMFPVLNCFQNKYWSIILWLLANVTEHLIALLLGGLYLYHLAVEIWFDIVQSEFIEIGC